MMVRIKTKDQLIRMGFRDLGNILNDVNWGWVVKEMFPSLGKTIDVKFIGANRDGVNEYKCKGGWKWREDMFYRKEDNVIKLLKKIDE